MDKYENLWADRGSSRLRDVKYAHVNIPPGLDKSYDN